MGSPGTKERNHHCMKFWWKFRPVGIPSCRYSEYILIENTICFVETHCASERDLLDDAVNNIIHLCGEYSSMRLRGIGIAH